MRTSYNLSEHELKTVLENWAREKGLQGKVQVQLHYTPGDRPGEGSVVTATVCTDVPIHPKAPADIEIVQPIGNCDGSRKYAYDSTKEDGKGARLAKPCPGCRACQ